MRRRLTLLLIPVLLIGGAVLVWHLSDWPPPLLVLEYGTPPAGGPTGHTFVNKLGMKLVEFEPGYFRTGSCLGCHGESLTREQIASRECGSVYPWEENEFVWTEVSRSFWIAEAEVTIGQYLAFDPDHERFLSPDDEPVVDISFEDALKFCAWLSEREPGTYRLPMASEWEYACRAGGEGEYCFGNDRALLPEYAWFDGNSRGRAHPVKTRKPNAWGLHDMHGNAAEWYEPLCPHAHEWIEWDGRGYTEERRKALNEERNDLIRRELSERGVDVEDKPFIALGFGFKLRPALRGGSWTEDWRRCAAGRRDSHRLDYASGFRVVWVDID